MKSNNKATAAYSAKAFTAGMSDKPPVIHKKTNCIITEIKI